MTASLRGVYEKNECEGLCRESGLSLALLAWRDNDDDEEHR